jgi:hypothetical protein
MNTPHEEAIALKQILEDELASSPFHTHGKEPGTLEEILAQERKRFCARTKT